MTLNAKLGRNGGYECPTKLVARNVMLRKTTLNIVNLEDTVAPNAKLERDNCSEHQNWRDGSKYRKRVNCGSERRTKN